MISRLIFIMSSTMLKCFLIFVLFTFFGSILTDGIDRFNININSDHKNIEATFQRCNGYCNKKYCRIYSSCRPVNRTSKLRRLDIYFHRDIVLEAPLLIEIVSYKKFRTEFRPTLIKLKEEVCQQLELRTHPFFSFFGLKAGLNGTLYDPCPMSGHRYLTPRYTSTWIGTLVPTGEWRADFILSKVVEGVEEHIVTVSQYYLVKPKDAADEF